MKGVDHANPNRDGDGYLVDMSEWTPEVVA